MEFQGSPVRVGSVHGRFQPFHNGHLEYVLAAKEHCDFLWIGITKCDPNATGSNGQVQLRERTENNPFTFFERMTIINAALIEAGLDRNQFGFTPFPIETPVALQNFLPISIRCYTTVCEAWNLQKVETLRGLGYEVVVLYEQNPKKISGITIRNAIVEGSDVWEGMVPKATALAIAQLGLRARLITLRSADQNPANGAAHQGLPA